MPRSPRPWYRKDRKAWFVTIGGQRYNLGPNREMAFKTFHELMATPRPNVAVASTSVLAVIDTYLDWAKKHRSERTFEWYLERCQSFCQSVPKSLTIHELKPYHVQQWVDAKECSPGHQRGCIIAIQRPLRWAHKMGLIEKNPIDHMEKPPAGRRDQIVTEPEYKTILRVTKDQQFRDLIKVAWEIGARPQELCGVESRHVELEHARWVFPEKESKGHKRKRVVYLTDAAADITQRLCENHSDGKIFRNTDGEAWNRYSLNCRFSRLRKHVGRKLCLYLFRHTWMTRLLKNGVDPITVATLAGHRDTSMLAKVYSHLHGDSEHLKAALRKGIR